jgi:hypothetical protein
MENKPEGKAKTRFFKIKDCVICGGEIKPHYDSNGEPYWYGGHNAEPVKEGRCCDVCNEYDVIPTRIMRMLSGEK